VTKNEQLHNYFHGIYNFKFWILSYKKFSKKVDQIQMNKKIIWLTILVGQSTNHLEIDTKRHMLICFFISMLMGKEKCEIVLRIRDDY
jgi:hypothetical protein